MNAPEKKTYHIVSSFHDELPKPYYPKNVSQFSNVDELQRFYIDRKMKLHAMFEAEVAVHKKGDYSKESLEALEMNHRKAEAAFEKKYKELRSEIELHHKELESSLKKGLE